MAEHEEQIFEHELKSRFEQLDAQIKIPEIPDAQGIFDRAEKEKGKVIPFKKYSRFVALAAAVALICVSIPIIGAATGISKDNMAAPEEAAIMEDSFNYTAADEAFEEPKSADPETYISSESSMASAEQEDFFNAPNEETAPGQSCSLPLESALRVYFDKAKSSELDEKAVEDVISDDVKTIENDINKKRSIEITVGEGSVSVILTDKAENEAIAVFWVEGIYQNSGIDEKTGNYVITLKNIVTKEDFEGSSYLPMFGDAQVGNCELSANAIKIPNEVTEGVITLLVNIDVGTGEYKITGELK